MTNDIYKYINKFFNTYLVNEITASKDTISSYKDTFKLLFKYIDKECKFNLKDFSLEDFTKDFILSFLQWLENERNNSISSRNTRFETIRSFCNFVLQYEISNNNLIQILKIPRKKESKEQLKVLSEEQVLLLLNQPNSKLKKGRRELTILSLLYDSALRISELLNLKVQDINLNDIKTVQVWHGKGNKNRKVPISDDTANIIRIYIKDYNKQLNDYLFTNNRNEKLCSNTIRKILNKYCDKVRKEDSTLLEHIYPHLLRHSKATHLINKGVSVLEVKEFLGHSSLESTQIYITTDIMKKRDALKTIENQIIEDNITINYTDDDIYNWLNNLEKVKL